MSLSRSNTIGNHRAAGLGKWRDFKLAGLTATIGVVLVLFTAAQPALGSVFVSGDVDPTDDPFTAGNEGLPLNGNVIEPFEPQNAQTFFEGIHDDGPDPDDPSDDDNFFPLNPEEAIYVGRSSFGVVLISGGSALRFKDLIIGDQGPRGASGADFQGTGIMRINGFGSLFNNNPDILPAPFHPITNPISSVTPRPTSVGYDLYVGRAGTGTLEISLGGRAEIQDAVIVGDEPGSFGTILVDGFDSFLGSGGHDISSNPLDPHEMSIGRRGIGQMIIRNGGRVVADALYNTNEDFAAAVIGSQPFDPNDEPELGGEGTVTVTGAPNGLPSQWIVGGTLQIGGFHDFGINDTENRPGQNVIYASLAGRGTLNVADGGIVMVRFGSGAPENAEELRMLIGRFGRLELNNGLVTIGRGDPQGNEGDARDESVQLVNDGVIRGGGRINTGVFHNRFFGEVRVDAGQRLIIDSATNVEEDTLPHMENWGLMQIIGSPEARAELEIERAPSSTLETAQPFVNDFVGTPPVGIDRTQGQITAAHATLRFRSGLSNFGKLTFIAGDNFVSGPVVNEFNALPPPSPSGSIMIAGNNTTVTFEDTFINNSEFEIFPNSSLAIFEDDFNQGAQGSMAITLGGRPTGSELSFLSVGGDANLDGTLEVNLFASGANPINPMAGDEYQILGALGDVNGIFTNLIMPTLAGGLTMFPVYDRAADTVTLVVASLVGVMGADFNGDGIVNGLDLAIWQQNVGIDMGATGAQGDADGDGDVDGDDFLIWQQTLGPVPGSGAGAGSGGQQFGSNVPEPGSFMLLLAASLALASHRRKAR